MSNAEAWIHTAINAASAVDRQAAASVAIAISLQRIADALTDGPRPNDGEKTYTGPVRVPSAAERAERVPDPFRDGSAVRAPDTHPSVVMDRAWWDERARRNRENAQRLLDAAKRSGDGPAIRSATATVNRIDLEARERAEGTRTTYPNETQWPIPEERPNELENPEEH